MPKREEFTRRKKDQNKEQDTAEAYPDICDIEKKWPVDPILKMNMNKINHMADLDTVDQIPECTGKNDKEREMIKKRQLSVIPDDINDKKN